MSRRVAIVLHEDTRTGAPLVGRAIADVLHEAGHDVTVVVRRRGMGGSSILEDVPYSVVAERLRLGAALERLEQRRSPRAHYPGLLAALATLARIRPDVVLANSSVSTAYVGAARRLGLPVVLHVHELAPVASYFSTMYGLDRFVHDRDVRMTATSHVAARDTAFLVGKLPEDIRVIRPGVPLGSARPQPTTPTLGGVGLMDLWKGPDLWLRVLAETDAEGLWVGDGHWRSDAERLAAELGVEGRFTVTGTVRDVSAQYRRMSVLLVASRLESLSLTAAEAMANGVPVVAFDVGGIREVVGDAGELVPPGRLDLAVEQVRRIISDPAVAADLTARGRHRVARAFDPGVFSELVLDVLDQR